jgi:hypothetical protein
VRLFVFSSIFWLVLLSAVPCGECFGAGDNERYDSSTSAISSSVEDDCSDCTPFCLCCSGTIAKTDAGAQPFFDADRPLIRQQVTIQASSYSHEHPEPIWQPPKA